LECTEGVILNFGVRWRGALTDEVEIYIGLEGRRVEEDEPYVYT